MSDDGFVDISGIDKARLLVALYERAGAQGLGILHYKSGGMSREEAATLLAECQQQHETCKTADLEHEKGLRCRCFYFDYLQGRVMKVHLGRDRMRADLYDRDNGQGAVAQIVAALRERPR